MALTKVINDLADLNQSGSTNALKGCAGTAADQPASSSTIEYLIVGGGGMAMGDGGGGAGAGGLLTGSTVVYHGTPTVINVGEGAPAKSTGDKCCGPTSGNGSDSGFNNIRALGGGSAGWRYSAPSYAQYTQSNGGGSGAGGGQSQGGAGSDSSLPGDGTSGQGLGGGASASGGSQVYATGGGGGAGTSVDNADGTGATGTSGQSGNGGSGRDMQAFISSTDATTASVGEVIGSEVWFAGGGGGGGNAAVTCGIGYSTLPGTGGDGGGGNGSNTSGTNGSDGQDNTGGGGGGGSACDAGYGGAGGSGVVILKYDNTIITGYTVSGISVANTFVNGTETTLVFKTGTGTITFQNDSPPGAEIGMLRHNNTLGQMEHFNSGGWKDFTNV